MCAELINKFVQAVTYEDDLEQQLNFYVECRSAFIKLDAVLIALVHVSIENNCVMNSAKIYLFIVTVLFTSNRDMSYVNLPICIT